MPTKTKPTTVPAAPPTFRPPSKSVLVFKLLGRAKGATIAEIEEPTSWQPHSTRAFLSGLRKKGMTIAREPRKAGETAYRIITATGVSAEAPAGPAAEQTPSETATPAQVAAGANDIDDRVINSAGTDPDPVIVTVATA